MKTVTKHLTGRYVLIAVVLGMFSSQALAVHSLIPLRQTVTVKILYKHDSSFDVDERTYLVDKTSDIRDEDNRPISFEQLPVPCMADVTYVTVNTNQSFCIVLKVKKKLESKSPNPELESP